MSFYTAAMMVIFTGMLLGFGVYFGICWAHQTVKLLDKAGGALGSWLVRRFKKAQESGDA